jgi:hypothetical protein
MSVTTATMKLGKRPRRHDLRTLQMARYLAGAGQAQPLRPPASVDYTHGITDWGSMLNDQLGCCTIAAVGHAVQAWTANALGRELTVPDSAILNYYEKWDGYDPANASSDQGGVELDVLNNWRQQGFDGGSLDAYVAVELGAGGSGLGTGDTGYGTRDSGLGTRDSVDTTSDAANPGLNPHVSIFNPIALAIWLFGGAYIGVELPIRAQDQDVWDVPAQLGPEDEPGSWGGHAIYLVGYDTRDSGLGTRDTGQGIRDSGLPTRDLGNETGDSGLRIQDPEAQAPNSAFRLSSSGGPIPDSGAQSTIRESRVPNPVSLVPYPVSRVPSPESRTLTCITWGKPKKMTFAWFEKYCSEAYALVSKDWLNASGVAPCGFDLATLESDLRIVTA